MKKLIATCLAVIAVALFAGSWKWGAPTPARADDNPPVVEVIPLAPDQPTFTADVVSVDAGAATPTDQPIVAEVTTSGGDQFPAIVMPTDGVGAKPVDTVSIACSWGW